MNIPKPIIDKYNQFRIRYCIKCKDYEKKPWTPSVFCDGCDTKDKEGTIRFKEPSKFREDKK